MKQFVIDRESNLPVEFVEDVEPYEEDENHQPKIVDFMRAEATDTLDLIQFSNSATNTERVFYSNVKVQT